MGCCCSSSKKRWTERHQILLEYLKDETYSKTVWNSFKLNTNAHDCLEYDEFCAILFIALEIYDKTKPGASKQLSYATVKSDTEIAKTSKYKRTDSLNLHASNKSKISIASIDLENTLDYLDIIAPNLAVQFDQDGDGLFSFSEFKEFGLYLQKEYKKIITGYMAPQVDNSSSQAKLVEMA